MIDYNKVNSNSFFAEHKIKPCPYCKENGLVRFTQKNHNREYSIIAYCAKCFSHTRDNIGITEYDIYVDESPTLSSQISGVKASQRDIVLLKRAISDWNKGFIKMGEYTKKREEE